MWRFGEVGWRELLGRLWKQFQRDQVLNQAAMLAFYFFLSIFPLLLCLAAVLGLMLQPGAALRQAIEHYLVKVAPGSASGLIDTTLKQVRNGSGGGTISIGLAFSLWAASSGVVALMDALNGAYGVREARAWWKQRLIALALTVGSALFMAIALVLLGYGDRVSGLLAGHLGVRSGLVITGWRVVKWLLLLGFVVMAFNLLYLFAPNVRRRRWHWLMPGTVLGVAVWLAASYGFKLYLTYFNRFNMTYGSIAGVIILLMWFYLTGIAILLGGELNSEIEERTHRYEQNAPEPAT